MPRGHGLGYRITMESKTALPSIAHAALLAKTQICPFPGTSTRRDTDNSQDLDFGILRRIPKSSSAPEPTFRESPQQAYQRYGKEFQGSWTAWIRPT